MCKIDRYGCLPQYVEIDQAIPLRRAANPQCNNCFAIAIPPAARMAHLKTMARRGLGSSHEQERTDEDDRRDMKGG
jgi:hypothetical protein